MASLTTDGSLANLALSRAPSFSTFSYLVGVAAGVLRRKPDGAGILRASKRRELSIEILKP